MGFPPVAVVRLSLKPGDEEQSDCSPDELLTTESVSVG